jgi:hypothetical protein
MPGRTDGTWKNGLERSGKLTQINNKNNLLALTWERGNVHAWTQETSQMPPPNRRRFAR